MKYAIRFHRRTRGWTDPEWSTWSVHTLGYTRGPCPVGEWTDWCPDLSRETMRWGGQW